MQYDRWYPWKGTFPKTKQTTWDYVFIYLVYRWNLYSESLTATKSGLAIESTRSSIMVQWYEMMDGLFSASDMCLTESQQLELHAAFGIVNVHDTPSDAVWAFTDYWKALYLIICAKRIWRPEWFILIISEYSFTYCELLCLWAWKYFPKNQPFL